MSTIGKVFVFLNLILAAVFLGSSIFLLQQHENWRLKYNEAAAASTKKEQDLTKQIDDGKKELEAQRSETNRRSQESEGLRGENGRLQAQVTELTNYRERTIKDIQSLATNFENFRKNNEELTKQLDEKSKSADAMRDERNAAKKAQEDAENKLAESEGASKQLDAQTKSLMEQVKSLTDNLKRAENGLAIYAERTAIPVAEVMIAPPLINGNVVAADMATKIIQLNVGADSNVKRGYGFAIYRGSEFKGEAIVEDVQPKFATARITKWVQNKKIEVGDQATTRLW